MPVDLENRPKLAWYDKGPGPAEYFLPTLIGRRNHAPTHRINPEYSFGLKNDLNRNPLGPGPAGYLIPKGLKSNGKFIGFEYTMRMKFPLIDKKFVPAPTAYKMPPTEIFRPKAPAFVFGSRTPLYSKKVSPGPIYLLPRAIGPKIPDKLAAAECTLKGDRKSKDPIFSPGPIYDVGRPDLIRPKTPAFSLRLKLKDPNSQSYEAGPASYEGKLPSCPCKTPLGWHMGIRYNDFTGIFRTQCDKMRFDHLD